LNWHERYLQRFYNRSRGWKDGTQEFHELCSHVVPAAGRILEIGAGPSNATSRFLAGLGELHGLDPDPDVRNNDALTGASVLENERFPYADASFDVCASNYVIEHVADPLQHLAEVRRVLRPGGAYVFRMPNRFHYVTVVSALTPHRVHLLLANRLRGLSEESHDPYPTVYRMNSRRAVRRFAGRAELTVEHLELIEKEPTYGAASRVLFLAFTGYERVVNSTDLLQNLRSTILGVLRTSG
jgi:SAM-dependent methyltransferase